MADRFRCGRCGATFDELDDLTQARVLSRGCPFDQGAVFPVRKSAWPLILLTALAWALLALGAYGIGRSCAAARGVRAETNR